MAHDVVVLGGGPGGYATALRAVTHGLDVAIVEADAVGGTCLHRGCIPSKALLHVAEFAHEAGRAADFGWDVQLGPPDLARLHSFRDGVVDRLHKGLRSVLQQRGVEIVEGWGRVEGPGVVAVDGQRIEAPNVVVATGSSASGLPGIELDGVKVLTSDDALRVESLPKRALIVGAGAVGVEFATFWASMGSDVTLVEALDRVLPLEDPDASQALERAFRRRGIDVRTGQTIGPDDEAWAQADVVLIAVGRRPVTADIGLDELGVLDQRGYVDTDELGRTTAGWLWAVGDVTPTLALAHDAYAEGFAVADAIAGASPRPVDHALVPRVTYSSPEVASVGLTEPEARDRGLDVTVTAGSFAGNAKGLMAGERGLVKLVAEQDGGILGMHVVGPAATELIATASLATVWGAFPDELADVVTAHPSLSEALRETALVAIGRPFQH